MGPVQQHSDGIAVADGKELAIVRQKTQGLPTAAFFGGSVEPCWSAEPAVSEAERHGGTYAVSWFAVNVLNRAGDLDWFFASSVGDCRPVRVRSVCSPLTREGKTGIYANSVTRHVRGVHTTPGIFSRSFEFLSQTVNPALWVQ